MKYKKNGYLIIIHKDSSTKKGKEANSKFVACTNEHHDSWYLDGSSDSRKYQEFADL